MRLLVTLTHRKVHAFISSYWDCSYDQALFSNSIALNLLYILALSDIERGWIFGDPGIRDQLHAVQMKGNKKEVSLNSASRYDRRIIE